MIKLKQYNCEKCNKEGNELNMTLVSMKKPKYINSLLCDYFILCQDCTEKLEKWLKKED